MFIVVSKTSLSKHISEASWNILPIYKEFSILNPQKIMKIRHNSGKHLPNTQDDDDDRELPTPPECPPSIPGQNRHSPPRVHFLPAPVYAPGFSTPCRVPAACTCSGHPAERPRPTPVLDTMWISSFHTSQCSKTGTDYHGLFTNKETEAERGGRGADSTSLAPLAWPHTWVYFTPTSSEPQSAAGEELGPRAAPVHWDTPRVSLWLCESHRSEQDPTEDLTPQALT